MDKVFSIAPMMEWTDRHCRFFHRLLTRRARLYTEMITTGAVLRGDRTRLLAFDPAEQPVAVQLGGSDPKALTEAARICADAAEGLPYGDDEFDLVYCSSVIEHVPPSRRHAFAAEIRRVGRGWFVQTPAYSFPIEPHSLLPSAHWLPSAVRRRYWRLGAAGEWEEIELLRRGELEGLFGPAHAERFAGLTKSWVCVSPPDG